MTRAKLTGCWMGRGKLDRTRPACPSTGGPHHTPTHTLALPTPQGGRGRGHTWRIQSHAMSHHTRAPPLTLPTPRVDEDEEDEKPELDTSGYNFEGFGGEQPCAPDGLPAARLQAAGGLPAIRRACAAKAASCTGVCMGRGVGGWGEWARPTQSRGPHGRQHTGAQPGSMMRCLFWGGRCIPMHPRVHPVHPHLHPRHAPCGPGAAWARHTDGVWFGE